VYNCITCYNPAIGCYMIINNVHRLTAQLCKHFSTMTYKLSKLRQTYLVFGL